MLGRMLCWILMAICVEGLDHVMDTEYSHQNATTTNAYTSSNLTTNETLMTLGHQTNDTWPMFGKLSHSFKLFAASCFILIIFVAVSCNILLITTILQIRKLHTLTHVFIVNMAVNDLIIALGTIPFDADFLLRGYFRFGKIVCGISHITFLISLPGSMLCLTLLTAERFVIVMFPFKTNRLVSKNNVIIVVVIMWVYTLAVALFPLANNNPAVSIVDGFCHLKLSLGYQIFLAVVNFLIPIIIICVMNAILLWVAHKHANKPNWIPVQLISSGNDELDSNGNLLARKRSRNPSVVQSLQRNLKAAKRIALLVGVVLICWLSFIILAITNIHCWCHPRELTWMGNVVNYSSSAINPVLYGFLNKIIRREFYRKWQQFRKCQGSEYDNRSRTLSTGTWKISLIDSIRLNSLSNSWFKETSKLETVEESYESKEEH